MILLVQSLLYATYSCTFFEQLLLVWTAQWRFSSSIEEIKCQSSCNTIFQETGMAAGTLTPTVPCRKEGEKGAVYTRYTERVSEGRAQIGNL
ncbi:hypothetical protein SAMN05660479_02323 [Microbulbifer thermotolerans]|nr:hypothetical protein SAMN05660479_02323 [Microbulbifer thermotolerans]